MKTLTLVLLMTFSLSALSRGNDSGGGFFHLGSGKTLDSYEAEKSGIEYIEKVADLEGYKEVVEPTLMKLSVVHPWLAWELSNMLKKTWMFVGTKMDAPEDPMTSEEVIVCGVHGSHRVKLYKPCFGEGFSVETKGILIFHELVRGISLSWDANAKDVREVTHQLVNHQNISLEQVLGLFKLFIPVGYSKLKNISEHHAYTSYFVEHEVELHPERFISVDELEGEYQGYTNDGEECWVNARGIGKNVMRVKSDINHSYELYDFSHQIRKKMPNESVRRFSFDRKYRYKLFIGEHGLVQFSWKDNGFGCYFLNKVIEEDNQEAQGK